MKHRLNTNILLAVLSAAAVISLLLCICIGPVSVAPGTVARILGSKLPLLGGHIAPTWTDAAYEIILTVRLPRVLLGFCVGCALAFSGTAMQTLVKNELADPYILGVSYGAAAFSTIGIVTGIFSFLGVYQNAVNGFIGAALSMTFVYVYSLNRGKINIHQLLLGGIAISMFAKAVVKILSMTNVQAFLHNNTAFWTSGGLAGSRWAYLKWPLLLIAVCFLYLFVHHRALNALLFGEEVAHTLGIRVARMEKALVFTISLMVGISVSVSGGIGFVGLVVPHAARILAGGSHKRVFPVAALTGGIFVLWCDVAARMLFAPEELSVGIITAIVGGPLFLLLLKRNAARI